MPRLVLLVAFGTLVVGQACGGNDGGATGAAHAGMGATAGDEASDAAGQPAGGAQAEAGGAQAEGDGAQAEGGGAQVEAGGAQAEAGAGGEGLAIKEPIAGLIDMQAIEWHNHDDGVPEFTLDNVAAFPGQFGGIVLNVAWSQLEPTRGAFDFSSIDDALAQVRGYNEEQVAAPLAVKLRVYAGSTAPQWAKEIAGGPVQIQRNSNACADCPLTVGKFWAPGFIGAWRALQRRLARRYDAEPLIRQVAVTSCAAQSDEPFVSTVDATSRATLTKFDATFDDDEQACLLGAVDDYADWRRTLIDYTFNPYLPVKGAAVTDVTFAVMEDCRQKLGSRCVLDNHALAWPLADASPLAPIYDKIQELGPPTNFQTAAPNAMDCQWQGTIALGVSLGAQAIEIWSATKYGFPALLPENIVTLNAEFTSPVPVSSEAPVGVCKDSEFN